GDLAHARAAGRILRQKRRLGPDLVEIFDDGQRLADGVAVVDERGDQLLRVDGLVRFFVLAAAALQQMHEFVMRPDALEVQRDSRAIGGGRTEIGVERKFAAHARATFWSIAPKIERPSRSSISIRTRSPNFMKGVFAPP